MQPIPLRLPQFRQSYAEGPWPPRAVSQPLWPEVDGLATANPADWLVAPGWQALADDFFAGLQGRQLLTFLQARLQTNGPIFPPQPLRALMLTPPEQVRVVIVGQDPYHGPGQAHGLAFSVPQGVKPPPSLVNIFKELARDPLIVPRLRSGGSLEQWASQGVLLLNTCLTVEHAKPASHAGRGWEVLTDQLISTLSEQAEPAVFMLWGAHAQAKRALLRQPRHLVLAANHPSPLSALRPPSPFIGCGHFGAANAFLRQNGRGVVQW